MSSTSVSVFHPYDDRRPLCSMPYHKAKELVLQGLAGWINRCKGIRLTSFLTNALRGRSCNISAKTIQKYVELLGTKRCAGLAAAINSWQFRAPITKMNAQRLEALSHQLSL